MIWVAAGAVLACLLAATGYVLHTLAAAIRSAATAATPRMAPAAAPDAYPMGSGRALEGEVAGLQERIDTLTLAVAEGIAHVERAENRIKATVKRARRELEAGGIDSPGLAAEAQELFELDAEGSGGPPVSPVREDVGGYQSSVPGVSIEQLQRARARGLN